MEGKATLESDLSAMQPRRLGRGTSLPASFSCPARGMKSA